MVMALFLVAGLFRHTQGELFMKRFKQMARAQVEVVRVVVEDSVRLNSASGNGLQRTVDKLAEAYKAKMWVTDVNGTVLAQSFDGPAPDPALDDPEDWDDYKRWSRKTGATVLRCDDDPRCLYVAIDFGGSQDVAPGVIHYFYHGDRDDDHHKGFFLGLVGIFIAVALLTMPVSWLITRRLNRLKASALRIGDGDLVHRAEIKGRDEVAGVGRAVNRMADSLARMIRGGKELTANVSHELRTPLTRMRIAEEMLREQFGNDLGERGVAHLDSIREDIESLDKLIGKLLTLSKLDLKENPFRPEAVDMADLVSVVADRIEPVAESRGVSLTRALPGGLFIAADGEALHTALTSIMENGAKYADQDGSLSIELRRTETGVAFVMENSHPVLSEDELVAIFEPFRRGRATRTQGTGLGLAIARKIIERHGGSVRAENCAEGVRFVVELPAGVDDV